MKESINKLKSLILHLEKITNSTSVKDIQRLRATGSDLTSTSKIITMMWKLNEETDKIFSELELLLTINPNEENVKMKKGLTMVGNKLIEKGKALIRYTTSNEVEILDGESDLK